MTELYERLMALLDTAGLEPEPQTDDVIRFWYREERYSVQLLPQLQALRISHPHVWHVASHLEFGVATFVANDMNQDSFATKFYVNNDDHYVYSIVEIFAPDAEAVEASWLNYMKALSWSIVEFRNRTEQSMQEEDEVS